MGVAVDYTISGVISLVVAYLVFHYKIKHSKLEKEQEEICRKNEAIERGIKALLRANIVQAYNLHIKQKYCEIHERESIEDLYKQYKSLGGNGTIESLMERIKDLPTCPPGE